MARMLQTNSSLIHRLKDAHDAESWTEFVALYEPLLMSYVRSRGLSEPDAHDIVQELFVTLLRVLPTFALDHRKGRFRTWLWQVTMNAIADHFRRAKKNDKAKEAWVERHGEADIDAASESDDEWNRAHRRRILEFVLPKVRAQTQPRSWYCFEEHVIKGRPGPALADELGITANAVCVNAGRVLDRVRTACSDYLEEFDDDHLS
jgi:RNA polymerase sigma factor (sigma-70 family)